MTADQWQRMAELFEAALEREPNERAAFVSEACKGDKELCTEVESLLADHEGGGSFMINPVLGASAALLGRAAETNPSPSEAATACHPSNSKLCTGVLLKGRYWIEKELGVGGIGVVYLARDRQLLNKPVVIKVLQEGSHQNPWYRKKFRQEIEVLARIDHPCVVAVSDAGDLPDGRPYFVMQYVEGSTLRSELKSEGMDLKQVAQIVGQVGQALAAAHEKKIWHLDLKPSNIMLQDLGGGGVGVKLIDFGIAKVKIEESSQATELTKLAGTIEYMAPEQLMGKATAASDIYALGVIAYEMAVGRRPFNPASPFQLLELQRTGVRVKPRDLRPSLPEAAQRVILKALEFDPKKRHRCARDFGEELAHALSAAAFEELPDDIPAGLNRVGPLASKDGADEKNELSIVESSDILGLPAATPSARRDGLEPVGGAVPLNSKFYIVRATDVEFRCAIARQDSLVLLKGARQVGKTSLLARGLQQAREAGAAVVLTDFQTLNAVHLESADALYLALAQIIADQQGLDVLPEEVWDPRRGPSINFGRYLRREVLGKLGSRMVWGLDEVDRLFTCRFGSEVFGLFRSWHNARSLDPAGPWQRLTLAMAYATEAHLFITDMNQSPFNVGTRLALEDFTAEQVAELNSRYGSPLRDGAEVARFIWLVEGQPYLVRCGLRQMASHGLGLAALEAQADQDSGPFGDHLRRMLVLLMQDSGLCEVVRGVLQGRHCPAPESFYRLRSAGLISGDSAREARPRCHLYATYLEKHLL
jgi:serine/threonine protein kinase